MFRVSRLLHEPVEAIAALVSRSSADYHDETVNLLRTDEVLFRAQHVPSIKLPRKPEHLTNLRNDVVAASAEFPESIAAPATRALLRSPLRAFPVAPPTKQRDGGLRSARLISIVETEQGFFQGVGTLSVHRTAGKYGIVDDARFECSWSPLIPDDLREDLVRAYSICDSPGAFQLDADPLAFLASPSSDSPSDWLRQARARSATFGFTVDHHEAPGRYFEQIKRDFHDHPPAVAVAWAPFAHGHQRVTKTLATTAPGCTLLVLEEPGFADALLELDFLLEAREVGGTLVGVPENADSWIEVAQLVLALSSPSFCLTDRARDQLKSNPYPHPLRMYDNLRRLAEAAQLFADAQGVIEDRPDRWLGRKFGLRIAMFDGDLDDTSFTFEGVNLSNEPHVKVDDRWGRCGRVYFAIDSTKHRFVVDHVGGHR